MKHLVEALKVSISNANPGKLIKDLQPGDRFYLKLLNNKIDNCIVKRKDNYKITYVSGITNEMDTISIDTNQYGIDSAGNRIIEGDVASAYIVKQRSGDHLYDSDFIIIATDMNMFEKLVKEYEGK